MDIFEEAFEALMKGDGFDDNSKLPTKLGIEDEIEDEVLNYRIDNLRYSQSMLSSFVRDRGEFFDKYIRSVFWSDSSEKDREYEKNMSFGRDFHLNCERIFKDIPVYSDSSNEIARILKIKSQYYRVYEGYDIEFLPEYTIELEDNIIATYDLIVKISRDGELKNIFIWDWKMEKIIEHNAMKRMQTKVYMYVCKESIGRELDFEKIVMYYYMPITNKNIKINYSKELHEQNKEEIFGIINKIRTYKRNENKMF